MPSESSRLHQRKMGYPGHSTRVRAPPLLAGVGSRRPRPQFCSPGRRYLRGVWLALGASDFRETAAAPGLHTLYVLAYAKGIHVSEAHPRGTDHLELPFLRRLCHAFSISYDLHRDFCFSKFVPENTKFHILVSIVSVCQFSPEQPIWHHKRGIYSKIESSTGIRPTGGLNILAYPCRAAHRQ
jgi:hypothetical protein